MAVVIFVVFDMPHSLLVMFGVIPVKSYVLLMCVSDNQQDANPICALYCKSILRISEIFHVKKKVYI
jgi:hypothetical protein